MDPTPAWDTHRTAVVTGGGAGIGLAISERLAAEGAAVAIWDRDAETGAAAAATIEDAGGRAVAFTVDVADRARVHEVVAEVVARLGAPTILVNNAGIAPFDRFLDIDEETLDQVIDVNIKGTFHCCQAVVPHMVEAAWGRIVNISSSSAQTGNAGQVHYSASKGAVMAMTKSLAQELGRKGITVNTVPPSMIDTPALRDFEERGLLGEGVDFHARRLPVGRIGLPADIAAACAYLTRDDAGFVTGQVLGVNGGRVI